MTDHQANQKWTLPLAAKIAVAAIVLFVIATPIVFFAYLAQEKEQRLTKWEIEECLRKPHSTWSELAACLVECSSDRQYEIWESRAKPPYPKLLEDERYFNEVIAVPNPQLGKKWIDVKGIRRVYVIGDSRPGSWGSGGCPP